MSAPETWQEKQTRLCSSLNDPGEASEYGALTGRYAIKCDDCKVEIGRTDELSRSAQGGRCDKCKGAK